MAYLLTQFIALLVDFRVLSQVLLDDYILGFFTTSLARRCGSRHHNAGQERWIVDEMKDMRTGRTNETRKEMEEDCDEFETRAQGCSGMHYNVP